MSDSAYNYRHRVNPALLDLVDEEWLTDTLPDEDIELPPPDVPLDPDDEEDHLLRPPEKDSWTDLALNDFFGSLSLDGKQPGGRMPGPPATGGAAAAAAAAAGDSGRAPAPTPNQAPARVHM